MWSYRIRVAVLIGVALSVTGYAAQDARPWPPGVQQVPENSPPLPPDAAMRTFFMPPGYRLELVASEPLIQDPILIDFDADGRLWAVEMPAFHYPDVAAAREREGLCRIVVLEDVDDDGRMDRRTVFLEGLVLARALKVLDDGVLVGEPPNLWLARDTNGDLKADSKTLVTDTYGTREANPEHNANALLWGMDNWLHTAEHYGYLRWKNGSFQLAPTQPRGQWGASQDDAGRIYRNTNGSPLFVDFVQTRYYMRNPNLARTRGMYESLQEGDVNTVWPVRPNRGVNRGYQFGVLRDDGSLARYTAAGSPTIYRGDRLPAELRGNAFVAESAGNLVSRLVLRDDGTTLRAARAYERGEFLASTDERFRPVWLSSAPDGTLYVVDMYRGVIQYRDLISEYLRDWIRDRRLDDGIGWGRIYRVVHESTRRDSRPSLKSATPATLVATLSHPNGWRRDAAQQLLVQRRDRSVVPSLRELARSASDPRTRMHALWTLDGLDALEQGDVIGALDDAHRDVRTAAVRLSERWLGTAGNPVSTALLRRLTDSDWSVRRQLAATLGEMQAGQNEAAIASLLERHGDDPITVDAALSGLRGREAAVLDIVLRSREETPQRSAAITMLGAAIVRSGNTAAVQRLFDAVAEGGRPMWQRAAVLQGAEVATLGARPPGTPARGGGGGGGGNAPCETCPGGRGGPGGARAFAGAPEGPSAAFFGSNPAPPPVSLTLDREPALTRVAAAGGDLGGRAAKVLGTVAWPGRPAPAAAASVTLTAVEEERVTAGQRVYGAQCQACHQQDGRGLPGVAPPLAGVPSVTGSPAIPLRVLLNGKEGAIGLMPPLGATMSDPDLAAVVTYLRRAWGNSAPAVDAAAVARVRTEVAGRTRPWTSDELAAVAAATAP